MYNYFTEMILVLISTVSSSLLAEQPILSHILRRVRQIFLFLAMLVCQVVRPSGFRFFGFCSNNIFLEQGR
jgi:hypothetical protein